MENEIFVKLNYKTIGEFKSLIVDRQHKKCDDKKYLMCTGKYDKNGWTFIFKANSIKEAEDFIDNNSRVINRKDAHFRKEHAYSRFRYSSNSSIYIDFTFK